MYDDDEDEKEFSDILMGANWAGILALAVLAWAVWFTAPFPLL
jgi:hypothetical protein